MVWKITPRFAEWLGAPDNPLFAPRGVLSRRSLVVELGCGVSGLAGLALAPRVARCILTDQPYVARLVEQNLAENAGVFSSYSSSSSSSSCSSSPAARTPRSRPSSTSRSHIPAKKQQPGSGSRGRGAAAGGVVRFTPLDWETDAVTPALTGSGSGAGSFDAVLACDCVYNEALVEPFVSTCVDVCRLRAAEAEAAAAGGGAAAGAAATTIATKGEGATEEEGTSSLEPCVCVVAQHLRDPFVFEAWLARFAQSFHVWRVPDELLLEGLRTNSGVVVHAGVLKDAISLDEVVNPAD